MFHKMNTWGSQLPGPQDVALPGDEVTLDVTGMPSTVDLCRMEATVRISYKPCFQTQGEKPEQMP